MEVIGSDTRTARQEEHVLNERCEHVPRLEVHEGADEVKTVGGSKRDDDVTERRVALDQSVKRDQHRKPTHPPEHSLREVLPAIDGMRHGEVYGVCSTPQGDDIAQTEEQNADRVRPLGTLRAVTERTDQDDEEQAEVELEEHFEDVRAGAVGDEAERIIGCV